MAFENSWSLSKHANLRTSFSVLGIFPIKWASQQHKGGKSNFEQTKNFFLQLSFPKFMTNVKNMKGENLAPNFNGSKFYSQFYIDCPFAVW